MLQGGRSTPRDELAQSTSARKEVSDPLPTRDKNLERYAAGPDHLEAALADLHESDLDSTREPGTWTVRQIVHHIVDGDDIWKVCAKAALGNPEAVFSLEWYGERPQDEWARCWNYADRAIQPSLALFRANRHCMVRLLEQVPDALKCSVMVRWPHGGEERLTVSAIIEMQADHALHHIDCIRAIRDAHGL